MIFNGTPYVLQKPQISYAAPFQHAAIAVTYCGPSVHVAPAPVVEYMTPATAVSYAFPAPAVNAAPATDVEYILSARAVMYGSPAPTVCVALAPDGKYISPAPTKIFWCISAHRRTHLSSTDGRSRSPQRQQCLPRQRSATPRQPPCRGIHFSSSFRLCSVSSSGGIHLSSVSGKLRHACSCRGTHFSIPAVITRQLLW